MGEDPQVRYRKSELGKKATQKYLNSELGKEARRRYRQSELGRRATLRYQLSEKGQKVRQRQKVLRTLLAQCNEFLKENPGSTPADFLNSLNHGGPLDND
jgi:hypothetical protein